ncbi:hypothetical protein [Mesorhizobium sp. L2C067A000]|uniref:hypothetical protein n=1 Tax=Mesorhizobium sp. L2C067A000 TaxID=1287106 RepID=UPI0003D05D7C|nr:hypothetical protein [Mesorhizobium sp. L2C067A000]ESZ37391.1 hypothetical protein X733_03515 [Mesorhizobium sp. L2C067A000]
MVTKAIALAVLIAIAGCATSGGSFCAVEHPIRPSAEAIAALSDGEVSQVLAHNEKGQKLCGWRP